MNLIFKEGALEKEYKLKVTVENKILNCKELVWCIEAINGWKFVY